VIPGPLRRAAFESFYRISGRAGFVGEVDRMDAAYRGSRAALDAAAGERLRALLSHALETVPFYRELRPVSAAGLADAPAALGAFPVMTKAVIREQGLALRSDRADERTHWNTSGGSTGEPVRLLQDRAMTRAVTETKMLYMRWLGFEPGERHLLVWGAPLQTFREGIPLRERVYRLVHHQLYLNCYEVSDDVLEGWVEEIRRHPPAVIEAYADAMFDLSRYALRHRRALPRPRGIITSAGVLTEERRQAIQEAFGGCPVLNRYGSREVGDVGCSCVDETPIHVSELMYFVEVVDAQGRRCAPGEEGDVLVTLLANRSMPLIRYRIEDRAAWADGPCSCGRVSRRLLTVFGRQSDFLIATDGTRINGTALTTLLYWVPNLRRFQFRQVERERVRILLEPEDPSRTDDLRAAMAAPLGKARQLLRGADIEVAVGPIAPSPSGKYRYIVNELSDPSRSAGSASSRV
jgi:phenylacetate-CoA ligase